MHCIAMNLLLQYHLVFLFIALTTSLAAEPDEGFCSLDNTEENCLKDESEKTSSFVLSQLQFDIEVRRKKD